MEVSVKKLLIAGGREFKGSISDFVIVKNLVRKYNIKIIVSGGAKGADKFGELCAKLLNLEVKLFPALWDDLNALPCAIAIRSDGSKYNRLAGMNRNIEMAAYADYVCLFPGGSGTSHMRREAILSEAEIVYDASL